MNCQNCSTPAIDDAIELSYFEALRAFWRVYWPIQLVAAAGLAFATGGPFDILIQFFLGAAALFVFAGRIVGRPYRGFSILVLPVSGTDPVRKLSMRLRLDVWAFLWWRQLIAGALAAFLSGPLNALLAIMGIHAGPWITVAGGLLVIGPILLKMLIGEPFGTFVLTVRRERPAA